MIFLHRLHERGGTEVIADRQMLDRIFSEVEHLSPEYRLRLVHGIIQTLVPSTDTDFQAMDANNGANGQNQLDVALTDSEFLLSIAGTFSSGVEDMSENVKSIVADALQAKYGT